MYDAIKLSSKGPQEISKFIKTLPTGTRLDHKILGGEFKYSEPVIRGTLARLAEIGLVKKAGKSTFIRQSITKAATPDLTTQIADLLKRVVALENKLKALA